MKSKLKIKLFWKVFGWFWLTIVVITVLFLFIGYVNNGKVNYRPLPPPLEKQLEKATHRAPFHLKNKDHKLNDDNHRVSPVYILNEKGIALSGKPVAELLGDLHSRVKRHEKPMLARQDNDAYFGGSQVIINGKTYWVYVQHREPRLSRMMLGDFFSDVARILIFSTFVVSFPISFLLSWIFTRPIRQLQLAVNAMQLDLSNKEHLIKLSQRGDEFGDLARDFEQMAFHLESLLEKQRQLISDVSHELRSPLTRLQIALGLLENQSTGEPNENIGRIKRESHRMNEMLGNLLTLSKLEALEINPANQTFDLSTVFKSIVDDAKFEASQSGIEIQFEAPDNCEFVGVKEALMSGIENVLRNAINYSDKQGNIQCRLVQQTTQISLSIQDQGSGVAEEQLAHLFDAFYRTDQDRARKNGGVGLGLAIAKRAVTLNGGKIIAENVKPHGLKVSMLF